MKLSRANFFLIAIAIFGFVLVYPPLRITYWLYPQFTGGWLAAVLLFVTPFAVRILHERLHATWSRYLTAGAMTWLGACFIAFSLLLPVELLVLLTPIEGYIAAQVLLAYVILISLYSIYNARRLHTRTVDLNAPADVRGTRLVQISDVHIGSRQPGFLTPIVKRINALEPDYVMITGDLIDMYRITENELQPLAEIAAPSFFCIGNHERYVDLDPICARLEKLGITVLRNRSATVTRGAGQLQITGIDDAESKSQVAQELPKIARDSDAYQILLYHRPDGAEEAAAWGADLMLTGHTHRGQIMPFHLLVKRVFPRLYLDYAIGDMTLYVSPGTGTWGPVMRLGSKCEVTLFRLL
jgi:predicted MPP superfamily phosphohydrolase